MSLLDSLVELTVPDSCLLCDASIAQVLCAGVCSACWSMVPESVTRVPGPSSLVETVSMGQYQGPLGELVRHAKYRPQLSVIDALGVRLGGALHGCVDVDLVTHVPTPWFRRWHRGFDQGERLGRAVSMQTGIPFRDLLSRRHAEQQVGKRASERRKLPVSAFRVLPGQVPERVLLVDDVRTTGASLHAAARALSRRGAIHVWGATICFQ